MTEEESMTDEEFLAPRNLGGVVAKFSMTEDGGAEVVTWDGSTWVPADIAAGELMSARSASPELLDARGVPSD